ncbi:MAG: DUF2887 domain-containing protein, partial [Desertifilum sp. SIO1I2]|nr:DUF2887 domain-containing protein [Desertifilum sp. SIO1I2]
YLNELEAAEDALGVNLIKLIVEPEQQAIASAKRLISQAQQQLPIAPIRRDIIELIETIIVYKLPQASREEIATMLGLTDLKQTRFYQDAFADGQEVGREEGRQATKIELIQPLADQGISPQNIAQLLKLSLDEVERVLQGSER